MDSILYDAVIKDNIHVLEEIELRLSVGDQSTPTNNTVLHLACQYGNEKSVKMILSLHISLLSKINLRGETALHLAARHGHYEVVQELIKAAKSSDPQPDNLPNTPSTALRNLIRTPNVEFETALHGAVRYNHKKVVELLVKEDPSHSHPQNKQNETPVYLATARGYSDVIKSILHHCESPTFGGPDGRTALHAAVLVKDTGIMKILLDKRKDLIRVADNNGWTAYHYVAYNDLDKRVEDLVRVDKFPGNLRDKKHRRTALHVAACEGNLTVLKELMKYFPDSWEIVDGNDQNILHIAAEKRQKNVISFILSHGFQANNNLIIQRDKNGNTSLHLIAKLGYFFQELADLVPSLDWEVVDGKNITPLDLLHLTDTELAEQAMFRREFNGDDIKRNWNFWRKRRELTIMQEDASDEEGEEKEMNENRSKVNTHMIVSALITTVALTAGFAMPGGFDGNVGPIQGSAILLRETAFKTFIVTDTIALLFSISALFLYFVSSFSEHNMTVISLLSVCALLNVISIVAMMLAFMTGTYAVLAHLPEVAITVCVISSLFILLVVCVTAKALGKFSVIVRSLILS